MKRFFGVGKAQEAGPTLEDSSNRLDKRIQQYDQRINQLEMELRGYREKIQNSRGSSQALLKQRALKLLKQKRMYENQRDQLMNQQFNIESASFATETMQDTLLAIDAMKGAKVAMQKGLKNMTVDDIEDLYDDMTDLYEQHQEVSDIMSRQFNTPEDIDDMDLEAELEALGSEAILEQSTPSYLAAGANYTHTDPADLSALPSVADLDEQMLFNWAAL